MNLTRVDLLQSLNAKELNSLEISSTDSISEDEDDEPDEKAVFSDNKEDVDVPPPSCNDEDEDAVEDFIFLMIRKMKVMLYFRTSCRSSWKLPLLINHKSLPQLATICLYMTLHLTSVTGRQYSFIISILTLLIRYDKSYFTK